MTAEEIAAKTGIDKQILGMLNLPGLYEREVNRLLISCKYGSCGPSLPWGLLSRRERSNMHTQASRRSISARRWQPSLR